MYTADYSHLGDSRTISERTRTAAMLKMARMDKMGAAVSGLRDPNGKPSATIEQARRLAAKAALAA